MNVDNTAAPGLRERKRAATRAAIELAAVELAAEHGYEATTVEMICEAAQISPRTFFNYFTTKEAAFVGTSPEPSEDDLRRFVEEGSGNVVADVVRMIASTAVDQGPNPAIFAARHTVMQRTPELVSAALAQMAEAENWLVRLILERYAAEGRTEAAAELTDEARMVVSISIGVMHFIMRSWFAEGFSRPPHELLQDSIRIVERVTSPVWRAGGERD